MKSFLPLLVVSLAAGVAGCGKTETPAAAPSSAGASSTETAPANAAPTPSTAAPATPAPPASARTIEVTGNDQMRFSVERIEVKAGEPLKLVFTNIGMLPKQAMGHNLVILKKGVNAQAYATAAWRAVATEYLPAELADQVVAATKLLGPKEKDELTFTAPAEPGEYPFLCTFPGHFALMKGVMVVQ